MNKHLALSVSALDAVLPGRLTALSTPVVATTGGWQLIVPAGRFAARDGRGPFVTGDRLSMGEILQQTQTYHGQTEMVVDYDHQTLAAMEDASGKTAKAAGWVKALEVRDDGIYANIEWTEAAAAALKAKEYRYLSPALPHDDGGNVRMILNVALTNVPAIHIEAFSASKPTQNPKIRNNEMDKILAALGLAKGSGEDVALSALNALLTANAALVAALGLNEASTPSDMQTAALAAIDDRKKLLEAAGVKTDSKIEDAVAALTVKSTAATAAPATVDPTKFVPIEQVTALQTDMKALRDRVEGKDAEIAVEAAIKDRKLTPSLRDWGIDLFKADQTKFDAFIGAAPALLEPQLKPTPKPGDTVAALTADQAHIAKVLGIDPKAYAETLKAESASAL